MDRMILGAALLHALLLVAAFAAVLLGGAGEGLGRGLHDRLGPSATMTGVLVNLLVLACVVAREAWIRRVERLAGLPGRFHSRAVRNRRRVTPVAVGGLGLLAVASWSWCDDPTGSSDPGPAQSLAHLALASVAIGYQGAALAVFAVTILGQRALALALKAEVDRLRPPSSSAADPDPTAPRSLAQPPDRLPP
ncbi:hypothetical protein [Tautonia marina]|uniref:hypothetical protein n=1 Tax=Tautonia marina TaxID=2653855 RepID=UPI001260FB0A|nr:hypothetical protein [Tautonia marina]